MNAIQEAILRPFSPDGGDIGKRRCTAALDQAAACDNQASYFESQQRLGLAAKQRKCAEWWRHLSQLSHAEADQLCDQLFLKTVDAVHALQAVGQKRYHACIPLVFIANAILDGLLQSAARGQKEAACAFLQTVGAAVNNFEFVALRKAQIFRPFAMRSIAIPGMISRSKAQSDENKLLLDALRQGERSYIAPHLRTKRGKPWKFERLNLLAVRLIGHIQTANTFYESDISLARHLHRMVPAWRKEATKLKPFSAQTWLSWAEVSWKVLKEISPAKMPALHPMFNDPKTQIFKVRTARTNAAYRKKEEAYSISEHDLKEALFGAFELLATGESVRTKQRRRATTVRQILN